jgi:hypothetical protein
MIAMLNAALRRRRADFHFQLEVTDSESPTAESTETPSPFKFTVIITKLRNFRPVFSGQFRIKSL